MIRADIRARLVKRLRIPPAGDPLLDEPTLNDCIAQALTDVSNVRDWPWLLTTASVTFTAGVGPLPTSCVKTRDLVINGWRARPSDLAEFLDQATYATMYMWSIIGPNIQLNPAPVTSPTNTLYYIRSEPALTTETQAPLIPDAHLPAVLSRASYHAEIIRARSDAAGFHNGEYEIDIKRMMDATKRSNRPRQIREAGYQRWASW